MAQTTPDSGWRGSIDGWLEAAYEALLEGGVDAVKILPLAKRLNLSRTSFYWFFKDREELLAALVTRWRDKNTGNLLKQAEAYSETIGEAVLNVFDCWLDAALFNSQYEFAMRSWSLQSDEILKEVQAADQTRLDALCRMYQRHGYDAVSADVHARTLYLVQIGYISMQTREDLETRFLRIPEYVTIFTGAAPKKSELDRFFSRHRQQAELRAARDA
jgi:AcrR family transcriptional regulator